MTGSIVQDNLVKRLRVKWAVHIERPKREQAQPQLLKDFAELLDAAEALEAEVERLQAIEGAVKRLFSGSCNFMGDGDAQQWTAYDYLKTTYDGVKEG